MRLCFLTKYYYPFGLICLTVKNLNVFLSPDGGWTWPRATVGRPLGGGVPDPCPAPHLPGGPSVGLRHQQQHPLGYDSFQAGTGVAMGGTSPETERGQRRGERTPEEPTQPQAQERPLCSETRAAQLQPPDANRRPAAPAAHGPGEHGHPLRGVRPLPSPPLLSAPSALGAIQGESLSRPTAHCCCGASRLALAELRLWRAGELPGAAELGRRGQHGVGPWSSPSRSGRAETGRWCGEGASF